MDFPYPTVALITGHTFGGACPFALAHDYRVMNTKRGFFCMPPVDLGLSFPGIGQLARMKLSPMIAQKMLMEAYRWTAEEALRDGIVHAVAAPQDMLDTALEIATRWSGKGKGGVYGVLRNELWGDAGKAFRDLAYVHSKPTNVGKARL